MAKIPYVQLDSDFIHATARRLAIRLKRSRAEMIGMFTLMVDFAIDATSTDETPPTGILTGTACVAELEGVAEWNGEPGALVAELVALEAVARTENGVRVRGMKRYVETWTKRVRDRERRALGRATRSEVAATAHGSRGARAATSRRETETEMESNKKTISTASPPEPPRSAAQQTREVGETEPTSSRLDPGVRFLGLLACAWEAERPADVPNVPDVGTVRAWRTKVLDDTRKTVRGEDDLLRGYRAFLRDDYWIARGCPWTGWVSQWAKFVNAANGSTVTAAHGGRVLRPVLEGA